MDRRKFLLSVTGSGFATTSGCLTSSDCDESSNHLYIENQTSDVQRVDIRVFKKSDELIDNGEWTDVFLETIEITGETHRIVEGVYDEYGTYRTEAECRFDQTVRFDQQLSEITECDGQNVTVGIGDKIVTILSGIPDHLSSENNFDS